MNVLKRIDAIMEKQHLTDYQLAKISGLAASTISNMRQRGTTPSIPTLEHICNSLNVSLSQFFADEDTPLYPLTEKQKDFFDYYILLSEEQQDLLLQMAQNMRTPAEEK